jgi:hypothetical protein
MEAVGDVFLGMPRVEEVGRVFNDLLRRGDVTVSLVERIKHRSGHDVSKEAADVRQMLTL